MLLINGNNVGKTKLTPIITNIDITSNDSGKSQTDFPVLFDV